MDFFGLMTILIVGLVVFGLLAIAVGADSREFDRDDLSGGFRI